MRRLLAIVLAYSVAGGSPVRAADANDIFSTILGEIGRQIEREQQKEQLKELRPLVTACSAGDLAACDRALSFPNLRDQARTEIARMREMAQQRPAYERNFYTCQKMDRAACDAALAYPNASDVDRRNLQNWQRSAEQQMRQQQALAEFRQNERSCFAGSLPGCDAALSQRQLDEGGARRVQEQRNRLLFAEEQRQRVERQHLEALAAFRQNERNCYAGSITACDAALAQHQLDERAATGIRRQRAQLLFAHEQRQLREQQRQAAIREYAALHQACASGDRPACSKATTHPQAPQADLAFLKRRDAELAPITEKIANLFADLQAGDAHTGVPSGSTLLALLGGITLIAAAIGVGHRLRGRASVAPFRSEVPPVLAPKQSRDPAPNFTGQKFPLTGHMPTDVRRALFGAQQ